MLPELWGNRGLLRGPSLDDFVEKFFYGWPRYEGASDVTWSPRVDINETDKDLVIDAELPGIDKKDVKVEVKDNLLTISGERKQEKKTEDAECCRLERHYGKFERSFALSDTVDTGKISAKYKDGVLTVTLAKTEKALPKEISVEVN
ncbi:Hsp20/alpha crystallin family protein [bacterium]|nr:Hsp20/alpha crystallin family protein [bacterium]